MYLSELQDTAINADNNVAAVSLEAFIWLCFCTKVAEFMFKMAIFVR